MARESCRNGVEVDLPGQTVGAIQARPEPAQFQFRATTHWISGAHVQTHIQWLMSQRKITVLCGAVATTIAIAAPAALAQTMAHPCGPNSSKSQTPTKMPMAKAQSANAGTMQQQPCAHKNAGKCAPKK